MYRYYKFWEREYTFVFKIIVPTDEVCDLTSLMRAFGVKVDCYGIDGLLFIIGVIEGKNKVRRFSFVSNLMEAYGIEKVNDLLFEEVWELGLNAREAMKS